MNKKIISFFLSILIAISSLTSINYIVYAQETNFKSIIETNPLYDEIVDKKTLISSIDNDNVKIYNNIFSVSENAQIKQSNFKESDILETITDASLFLKNEMINRENCIVVKIKSKETDVNKLVKEIFYNCFSPTLTDKTQDGDYLKWHWGGYKASGMISNLIDSKLYSIVYEIGYYTTAEEESAVTKKINETINNLDLNNGSDYIKIKKIHDFVCDTIQYDYINVSNTDYKYQFTTYGALFNGRAVCQGYATLFYRLCREVGIPVRIITSSNHAWNIVKIDNKYYNIDCTWDDSDKDTPGIPTGDYWSNIIVYKWFLNGSDDFPNHIRQEEYTTDEFNTEYPMAQTTYVCEHKNIEWVYPENATCTKGFEKKQICTNCEKEYAKETIPAGTNHKFKASVVSPTCSSEGYTHYTCINCNYSYASDYTNTVNHKYTKYTYNNNATCTKDGTQTATCDYGCGTTDTIEATNTALGHNLDEGTITTPATCTSDGVLTKTCKRDGCNYSETSKITATGHKFTKYIYNDNATCTEDGTQTATCDNCGATDTIKASNTTLGHDLNNGTIVTPATCTGDGVLIKACKRNNCNYTETLKIAATGHNYKTVVTKPTCTEQGYTTYTCTKCNDSYVDDYTAPTGHKFTKYIYNNDATCTEDGTQTAICDYGCGTTDTITVIDSKTGHHEIYKSNNNNATHDVICSICNAVLRTENCDLENDICKYCGQNKTHNIIGKVVVMEKSNGDHSNNYPISNANIYVDNELVAKTNNDGSFVIQNLENGTYKIKISSTFSFDRVLIIDVNKNDVNINNVSLMNCDINKDGIVNLKDTIEFYKGHANNDLRYDLNNDGKINGYDLKIYQQFLMSENSDNFYA